MPHTESHQTTSKKTQSLKKAILSICNNIPPSRLNCILEKIDTSRRYFIQATRNPQKFLNIVSSETIVTDDTRVLSETTHIYGDFIPGRFTNIQGTKHISHGSIAEQIPAAGLKSTFGNRYFPNDTISYTLVIYEPKA